MNKLIELHPPEGSTKDRKRRGRGEGSGLGRQSGRGHKGWHSRSGSKRVAYYEGGQMPLVRRIPKRGFSNLRFQSPIEIVNVSTIAILGLKKVDPTILKAKRAIKHDNVTIKILGNGEIDKAVEVSAHRFSKSAIEKIEKAGGKAHTL